MKKLNSILLMMLYLGLCACGGSDDTTGYYQQWLGIGNSDGFVITLEEIDGTVIKSTEFTQVLECRTADEILGGRLRTYYNVFVPKDKLIEQLNKGDIENKGYLLEGALIYIGYTRLGGHGGGYSHQKTYTGNLKISSQFIQTKSFEITDAFDELDESRVEKNLGTVMLIDNEEDTTIGKSDGVFFPREMECKNTGWESLNIINYKK